MKICKPRYIVNLTQHDATPEQFAQGVYNVCDELKPSLKESLTFGSLPSIKDLKSRAKRVASLVLSNIILECEAPVPSFLSVRSVLEDYEICAMIGGAPFFMPFLERALIEDNITPLYAFSKRVSIEETQPDGTVLRRNVFKHEGFVEVL